MANDGIKLPSDSTVASQKVHRGNGLPETEVPKLQTSPAAKPSPLLTVVLQSRPLIEGAKGQLFELLLQNDPKSEPPIKIHADTEIKPGTSLFLELNSNDQYRPVEKPNLAQLAKLVQLELDFWRAHLLPKAGHRVSPTLPSKQQLQQIQTQYPQLKPLMTWMLQRPSSLSAKTIAQWFHEQSPVNHLRPNHFVAANSARQWPLGSATPDVNTNFPPASVVRPNILMPLPAAILRAYVQLLKTNTVATQTGSTHFLRPPMPLNQVDQFLKALSATTTKAENSQPNTQIRLQHAGSLTPTTVSDPTVIASQKVALPVNAQTSTTAMDALKQVAAHIADQGSNKSKLSAEVNSINKTTAGRSSAVTTSSPARQGAINKHVQEALSQKHPIIQSDPANKLATPIDANVNSIKPIITTGIAVRPFSENVQLPKADVFNALQNTARTTAPDLPLEIRLSQWVGVLNEQLSQSPDALKTMLTHKAAELINPRMNSEYSTNITNTLMTDSANKPDEQPLLALKNWLEAAQARMQNMAIQTAATQWATPEQQTIQQIQIPLIWLGLTNWADVEWWQQPKKKSANRSKKERAQRRWRMRLFLTLAPLEPICADLSWSTEFTRLTIWSEDAATLNHLNSLLPKLDQWTAGLGEKQLQTKHGMPKRHERKIKRPHNHLVDVRT